MAEERPTAEAQHTRRSLPEPGTVRRLQQTIEQAVAHRGGARRNSALAFHAPDTELTDLPPDIDARPMVMSLLIPDEEDPMELLGRGRMEVEWRGGQVVKKFQHKPFRRIVDRDLALPGLYLHNLPDIFKVRDQEFTPGLRSGNDNAEQQLVLPEQYTSESRPMHSGGEDLDAHIDVVMAFLQAQATAVVSEVKTKAAGFSPKKNYAVRGNPQRWYYSLKTSRPKADISLDKASFGIPEDADLYLFAENHETVAHMIYRDAEAFKECIANLAEEGEHWQMFSIFLKVFYEGAFAYNKKMFTGEGSYLPKNISIAALGVAPAFEGQAAIRTGYPYLCKPEFLDFTDTVPVTIEDISDMSERHKRYGLCFTRCVWVWEGEDFEETEALNFASVMPHGGFFYVPESLGQFNRDGGLVYAFGEELIDMENAFREEEQSAMRMGGRLSEESRQVVEETP